MKIRIALGILAVIGVLWWHWWVSAALCVMLLARWRAWEVVGIALLADLVYTPLDGVWYIPLPLTVAALVLLLIFEPLRTRLMVER